MTTVEGMEKRDMDLLEKGGARFLDEHDRYRGWAGRVTKRIQALTGLTVLEVSSPEPQLAMFLTGLDKARLRVQHTDSVGESYTFTWASGYENGANIRIQGMVEAGKR